MNLSAPVGHVLKFWRIPNSVIDRINPWCQPFAIASPAALGSITSVWIIGVMGLCLVRTLSGAMALTDRSHARMVALVFASWFMVHLLFGLAHSRSAETLLEIVETLPFLGVLFLYAGLALSAPQKLAGPTEIAAAIGAIIALVIAAFEIFSGWSRAEGITGNPGPFAVMTLLLYGYCLVGAARNSGKLQLLAAIGVAAAFCCVVLSGMRATWPGLLLLPIVVALIYRKRLTTELSARQIVIITTLFAVALFATLPILQDRVEILFTELAELDWNLDLTRSLDQHVALWSAGAALIVEAPLTGHGLETVPLMVAETQRQFGAPFALSHFHNALIDIGVKCGITGIATVIAMMTVPLILTAKARKTEMGRFGFAMMSVLMISYSLAGTSGLMLGHDIMDTVFIFSVTYWCVFAFEADKSDA